MGNKGGSMSNHRSSVGNKGGSMGNSSGSRSIRGNSFIGDLSNVSAVGISCVIVDNLGSSVRKGNSVGSSGGIAISLPM